MKRVLVVGATSAIAQAAVRIWAARGDRLFLIARDSERLDAMAADLRVRGASAVDVALLEVTDFDRHVAALQQAFDTFKGFDIVLIAHGSLPDQRECETSVAAMRTALDVNATSVIALATLIAPRLESQRSGTLAVIGSVAGDRGRQSNYLYGTAKAAVATFLQGLRNRLHPAGVNVLTIKPGFVDTPMTAAFPKGPLWASAETVAKGIVAAIDRKADVVYLPGFWWLIMLVIKLVPEKIFKGLKL